MKRQLLTIVVVLLATIALTGCGVPQEDYDQVVGDLTAAQTEIAGLETEIQKLETELATVQDQSSSLQNELDAAIAEYKGLQTEYDDLSSELDDGMAEYSALQSDYDDLNVFLDKKNSELDSAYVYHSIVIELLAPAVTGDALTAPETKTAVGYFVEEAADENLQKRFDAWSASTWNRELAYELLWYAQVKLEEMVFEMGN
jgi:regulator of replication initiation timing